MGTKVKHTPGPWEMSRVPIQSRGGSNTCWKIGPFNACIYDDWRSREIGIDEEENMANARLIAAAPELADALEDVLDRFCPDELSLAVLAARAALRKAGRLL